MCFANGYGLRDDLKTVADTENALVVDNEAGEIDLAQLSLLFKPWYTIYQ